MSGKKKYPKTQYPSEFWIWVGMRARCGNPNHRDFVKYGARGIQVCERWQTFENFFADMGPRPFADASVDRINNDGHYEPSNCRWTDRKTQARNTRSNRVVSYNGKAQTLSAWSEELAIPVSTIRARLSRGIEITKPIPRPRLQVCKRGHAMTDGNVVLVTNGASKDRRCRICFDAATSRSIDRQREARQARRTQTQLTVR